MTLDALHLVTTALIGFSATLLFVATGGVGMITVPALIFLGLSPQAAIATDIFAMFGGRIGGLIGLRRAGKVDFALGIRLGAVTAVGSVLGAFTLLSVPVDVMKRVLAVFLLLLLAFLVFRPSIGLDTNKEISARRRTLGTWLFVPVGFWATLIGAGFLNLGGAVLLFVFRKTFLETAGLLTLVGLAAAVAGLAVFGTNGTIIWPVGLAMLVGKTLGGYIGARFATRLGERAIRWLFVAVVLASAVQLILS